MEEDNEKLDLFLPPIHTNTFAIPNDHNLRNAFVVYKPSRETRILKSEQGRKLFAEAFMEDDRLGTLSDLCVRTMAKAYGMEDVLPIVTSDPLKMRIHYDSISVELPLLECYTINDALFWKRVVLSKHKDKSLAFEKNYNWKNVGISLKLVEMIEACPAEYWPEDEMHKLALKIREYITELHIRRLKSLQERSFEEYYESDEVMSDESSEISSDHSSTRQSIDFGEGEGEGERETSFVKTGEQLATEAAEAAESAARKALEKAQRKEEKDKKRAAKEAKRLEKEAQRAREEEKLKPKGKKKKQVVNDVLSIPISEEEDDGEAEKADRRNLEKYLHKKKKYKYPPEHCHHIDLRFLKDYIHLTSLTMEFLGPKQGRDYHTKHFNFSYKDMENFAYALKYLILLKTFRLINSRMDARKMEILLKALETLTNLELLDLSNDQLKDDCGEPLYELFKNSKSIKHLELRGNEMGSEVLRKIAEGLSEYEGVLDYLGFANNILGYAGFHALVNALLGKEHIKVLNLRGVQVEQDTIVCCIAQELIAQHSALEKLDIAAVHIGSEAGIELIKAVTLTRSVKELDCRGCDLNCDIELEVELLMQRNRYIEDNPYIGNESMTEVEIMAHVNRVKNPILLKAMAQAEKLVKCRQEQPDEFDRYAVMSTVDLLGTKAYDSEFDSQFGKTLSSKSQETDNRSEETVATLGRFISFFNPNEFNEEQFMEHVYIPGPSERYYYFKEKGKQKDDITAD